MSLSQRWHQHFFKRGNRFSLQGLFLESACMNPVQNNRIIPTKSWTFQRHHSFTNAAYFFSVMPVIKNSYLTVEQRQQRQPRSSSGCYRNPIYLIFFTVYGNPAGLQSWFLFENSFWNSTICFWLYHRPIVIQRFIELGYKTQRRNYTFITLTQWSVLWGKQVFFLREEKKPLRICSSVSWYIFWSSLWLCS